MTMAYMIKIEKGIKPRIRPTKFNFDKMMQGDTFTYSGAKSVPITHLGYRLIRGKYTVEKEGKGWRFHLLRDVRPLLSSSNKPSKYNFETMKVGDSFHYKGSRSSAITTLASRAATGKYKITAHDDGWLFELIKPIIHLLS